MPRLVKINDQLAVPMPGFGGMGLSQSYGKADDEESKKLLRHAIDIGCTFWNTATIYGPEQHNEKLIGQVLREGDNRSKVFITTKWGLEFEDGKLVANGSPAFAEHCLEQSLQNLGSYPDAWLLHRVDKKTPIEESVAAMEAARKAGKCQFIGLSAMSASTLRRATKVATIDFVEMDFSPFETSTMEKTGVLETCKELGIRVFAYSPLGKGFLTGRFRSWEDTQTEGDARGNGAFPRLTKEVWDHNFKLVEGFEQMAKKKGCTPGQLALAWDMSVHGDIIMPIPGTKNIKYLDENFASADITLSDDELKEIRSIIDSNPLKGAQYSEMFASLLDLD